MTHSATIRSQESLGPLGILRQHWEIIYALTYREIKGRYKQSFVGIGWAVIQPFFLMIIFSVVFGGLAKLPSEGIPYPVFSYTAVLPWTLFASSLSSGATSVVSGAGLIDKVYFPRQILPLAAISRSLVDFGFALLVFIPMLIYYRVSLTTTAVLVVPLLLLQLVLAFGVSLFLGAVNTFYRDIGQAIGLASQIWMYLTPVAYSVSVVPEQYYWLYRLNPMVGIIDGYRRVVLRGQWPEWPALGISLLVTLLVLLLSWRFFRIAERYFVDVV